MEADLHIAADALRSCDALLITAGAGLGVDGGLPDFRGGTGFWKAYPPYARADKQFEELACPQTLVDHPALFWGFYEHRRVLYRSTPPHAGYGILRRLAEGRSAFVFTSNVDGHFLRAGFADEQILECHGSIHHFQCATPCGNALWMAGETGLSIDTSSMHAVGTLPVCRECGGSARPNVLMFNDDSWVAVRAAAQRARYREWMRGLGNSRFVVLELGAGAALPTVRREGEAAAARNKGTLIRVNPRDYQVDWRGGISLPGGALAVLSRLAELL